jgi:hypothetical protein
VKSLKISFPIKKTYPINPHSKEKNKFFNLKKKMCRVSARRLSIYNFAWELLKATNLQAESKILKYWNIKSTNQNEKFSKKSMFGTLKV